jgi:hypothetical protein
MFLHSAILTDLYRDVRRSALSCVSVDTASNLTRQLLDEIGSGGKLSWL